MLGENQITGTETDLVLALLEADPDLGCHPEHLHAVRWSLPVRRAIAEQTLKPSLHRHRFVVDYDNPAYHDLGAEDHDFVHDALTPEHFPVTRTGCHQVTLVEIFADCSLNVASQRRLIKALGFRRPCLAETRAALNTMFREVAYPIMSLCGRPFSLNPEEQLLPSLHCINAKRILHACRSHYRWSQEYRLLAVAES
jgi:hypothetical protein